jgi:hypothetical protein
MYATLHFLVQVPTTYSGKWNPPPILQAPNRTNAVRSATVVQISRDAIPPPPPSLKFSEKIFLVRFSNCTGSAFLSFTWFSFSYNARMKTIAALGLLCLYLQAAMAAPIPAPTLLDSLAAKITQLNLWDAMALPSNAVQVSHEPFNIVCSVGKRS